MACLLQSGPVCFILWSGQFVSFWSYFILWSGLFVLFWPCLFHSVKWTVCFILWSGLFSLCEVACLFYSGPVCFILWSGLFVCFIVWSGLFVSFCEVACLFQTSPVCFILWSGLFVSFCDEALNVVLLVFFLVVCVISSYYWFVLFPITDSTTVPVIPQGLALAWLALPPSSQWSEPSSMAGSRPWALWLQELVQESSHFPSWSATCWSSLPGVALSSSSPALPSTCVCAAPSWDPSLQIRSVFFLS